MLEKIKKDGLNIKNEKLKDYFIDTLKLEKNYIIINEFTESEYLQLDELITSEDLQKASTNMLADYDLQDAIKQACYKQLYLIIDEKVKQGKFKFKNLH